MPIIKSAKKALRQNLKRKIENKRKKRKVKDSLKKIESLISQKNFNEAEEFLPEVYKKLDKAVKTKIMKKNAAARKKSRIAKLIKVKSINLEN